MRFGFILLILFMILGTAQASENLPLVGRDTGLPLPRFASLKNDEVFVRAGPGQRYPIKFVYQRVLLPVEIIGEFGGWRKVRDARGGSGWVYNALISGQRSVLVQKPDALVHRKPKKNSPAVAELAQGVIAELSTCEDDFCKVEGQGFEGWVVREALWGLSSGEEFAN